ncbi:hypothetical protein ACROSR_19490 [Roseovarius tibetensis]|uniref:hypothetical protein n=1 Tax=Roseovarius tibetensis TaxID=2685897 RepID=UPI003D7F2F37
MTSRSFLAAISHQIVFEEKSGLSHRSWQVLAPGRKLPQSEDVVVGNVAVRSFGTLLKLLRRGRRYASSGAIAGPIVELDMRDTYLRDITSLISCTA